MPAYLVYTVLRSVHGDLGMFGPLPAEPHPQLSPCLVFLLKQSMDMRQSGEASEPRAEKKAAEIRVGLNPRAL